MTMKKNCLWNINNVPRSVCVCGVNRCFGDIGLVEKKAMHQIKEIWRFGRRFGPQWFKFQTQINVVIVFTLTLPSQSFENMRTTRQQHDINPPSFICNFSKSFFFFFLCNAYTILPILVFVNFLLFIINFCHLSVNFLSLLPLFQLFVLFFFYFFFLPCIIIMICVLCIHIFVKCCLFCNLWFFSLLYLKWPLFLSFSHFMSGFGCVLKVKL